MQLSPEDSAKAIELLKEVEIETRCRCDPAYTQRGRHEPNAICYLHVDVHAFLSRHLVPGWCAGCCMDSTWAGDVCAGCQQPTGRRPGYGA